MSGALNFVRFELGAKRVVEGRLAQASDTRPSTSLRTNGIWGLA
jgi:hypothetical protein